MISPIIARVAKQTGLDDRLSAASLQRWQLRQVRRTLEYARHHSRLYSERLRGIEIEKIGSLADMQAIPFTWPEDLMRDSNSLMCVPGRDIARIVTLSTSGSQGAPKRVCFTQQDIEQTLDFFAYGMSTMVNSGQSAVIFMSGETRNSVGDLLRRALTMIGVSSEIHGRVEDVRKAIEAARTADCLIGLPAEMMYLCRTDGSLNPDTVLLSADYVPDSVIEGIERTWECRVFTHYGMTEMGFGIGVQCEARRGHHLRDADLLVEVVDPQTGLQVPPGDPGEIVITTLRRESMPFIRYRTGDMSHMEPEPCPCGGTLPQLGKVMGRRANVVFLENGKSLSIHCLDEILFAVPEVRNFEARLFRRGGLEVLGLTVDAEESLKHEGLMKHLKALLCDMEIEIKFDRLSASGWGKRSLSVQSK